MATASDTSVEGRGTARAPEPPVAARPGTSIRTRAVIIYLLLAALVLTPGALLKSGAHGLLPALKPRFDDLSWLLDDIRFGSGLRFWLGVGGATMMGLLLLYPLRKALGARSWIGRVAGWFHIHIVFGIAGPVAIAYHTNFGHGGSNANLALWTMVVVALSGIAGHFVYASASAEFYRGKLQAREQIDAIAGILGGLDANHDQRQQILADFAAFEAELLTPRQGVVSSLMARLRMEQRRRRLSRALGWHLSDCAAQLRLSDVQHADLRARAGHHLAAYMRIAGFAARRSVREQIWARWRLFHLPVFLIMVVATVLHVAAVWNIDATPAPRAAVRPTGQGATKGQPGDPLKGEVKRVLSIPVTPGKASAADGPPAPRPQPATRRVTPSSDSATSETRVLPKPAEPRPETRTAEAPKIQAPSPEAPKPIVRQAAPTAPAATLPPEPPDEKSPTEIDAVYKELARRSETGPMALGGAKPGALAEQIAAYKARRQSGQFAHADAETGFALTGRHVKLDCADCHTAPLRDVRSPAPRRCVACHTADDIHRGRRPNCAQCHTTNRWSQRIEAR